MNGLRRVRREQLIRERDHLLICARIALAAAAANQLTIDPRRLRIFSNDDVQAAVLLDLWRKLNVGAAPSHTCCDSDTARRAGLRDNGRFFSIVVGVKDNVVDARLLEEVA